jgi:hypothetical protein
MRLLAPAAALVLLAGCADSIYYQTRYAPTSSSGSFSLGERMFRTEDKEVYELPANPPALSTETEDGHRSRVECRRPGQAFKSDPIAGVEGDEIHGNPDGSVTKIAVMSNDLELAKSPGPDAPQPLAGWHDEERYGTRERRDPPKVGAFEDRAQSVPGSGTKVIAPNKIAVMDSDPGWCPPKP